MTFPKVASFFLALFFAGREAPAAPCCAGSSSVPFLITTDDRSQLSLSFGHSSVRGTAFEDGSVMPKDSTDAESLATISLRGSFRFAEDFQVSAELPLVRRSKVIASQTQSEAGLADISATVGYEVLPETLHSDWRPKGFLYSKVMAPTGTSMYEVPDPQRVGLFGKGFYEWSLGAVLLKTWGAWDALVSAEGHWILPRAFTVAGVETQYGSAWGTSALIGLGFSPAGGNLRAGANFGPLFETGRDVMSEGTLSKSLRKWVWTASATLSYRFHDEWSALLAISDQTLFVASNLDLNRSITLSLLHNLPL